MCRTHPSALSSYSQNWTFRVSGPNYSFLREDTVSGFKSSTSDKCISVIDREVLTTSVLCKSSAYELITGPCAVLGITCHYEEKVPHLRQAFMLKRNLQE